jgi:hypothetical protein
MRECIFCGGRVNSKEHAWPAWLLKFLKRSPDENVPIDASRLGGWTKRWDGINASLKLKKVCRTRCNDGWMSLLEDRARPILSEMILGNAIMIDRVQQLRIAQWATKCAMVFDSMDPGARFYDASERFHFRETLTPAPSTNVWLGNYSGSTFRALTVHRTVPLNGHQGIPYKGHIQTMVFGRLVIQTFSVKRLIDKDGSVGLLDMLPKQWDQSTIRVWPVSVDAIRWPPSISFDDSQRSLQPFADRLSSSIRNANWPLD